MTPVDESPFSFPMETVADALAAPPLAVQLRRRFADQAGEVALHVDGRWLTYGELGRRVYRTANALYAAGAVAGARVGVMLPNGEAFVRAWLALSLLNVTMVPLNVNLVGAGLRHPVEQTEPDLLLTDEEHWPALAAAFDGGTVARRVLVWGGATGPHSPTPSPNTGRGGANQGGLGGSNLDRRDEVAITEPPAVLHPSQPPLSEPGDEGKVLDFRPFLAAAPATPPPSVDVDPADLALIVYTSGTTGPSKGVMLSRTAQLWHAINYFRDFIQLGPGERAYTPLPLFHVSAQGFSLGCLLAGRALAVDRRFQPFAFWRATRRYQARAFNYVGAMIPLLYHRRPRPDDRENPVRLAVGSATAAELHEPFERRFGLRLIECYGQSEMAGLWLMDPPAGRRIGTVGTARRWCAAAILRPDGSEAEPGEQGEIAIRPEHPLLMTAGYWREPEATARAFRDGWYWTGDAGERDSDGYIRFRGRLKDFIRRRGENISAWEIEREALTHPAVREAAAVGVPSPLGEDEVKLCVLAHDGASLDPAELDRHLRPRLAAFARPRYIEVRADFPRTPTQRVQKFRLREEGRGAGVWERGQGGPHPPAPSPSAGG